MVVLEEPGLKKMVSKYKYRDLTVCETVNVITLYKDLKPVLDSYIFNDGNSRELMNLTGTIPVPYRNNTYSIPICLWLLDTNPYNPLSVSLSLLAQWLLKQESMWMLMVRYICLIYMNGSTYSQTYWGLFKSWLWCWRWISSLLSPPTISASYPPYQAVEPSNTSHVPGVCQVGFLHTHPIPPNPSGYPGCPYDLVVSILPQQVPSTLPSLLWPLLVL